MKWSDSYTFAAPRRPGQSAVTSSSDSIRFRSPSPVGSSSASFSFSVARSLSDSRFTFATSAVLKKLVRVTVGRPGGRDTERNSTPSGRSARISPRNVAPLVRRSSSNGQFDSPAGCAAAGAHASSRTRGA